MTSKTQKAVRALNRALRTAELPEVATPCHPSSCYPGAEAVVLGHVLNYFSADGRWGLELTRPNGAFETLESVGAPALASVAAKIARGGALCA